MKRRRFAEIVEEAMAGLPAWVRPHLENVAVVIEDWPSEELLESLDMDPEADTLLGFYDGVPLTERAPYSDGTPTPVTDTITIYQRALEEECESEAELIEQIRITVVHEVGHHLGLEDDRIEELGYG